MDKITKQDIIRLLLKYQELFSPLFIQDYGEYVNDQKDERDLSGHRWFIEQFVELINSKPRQIVISSDGVLSDEPCLQEPADDPVKEYYIYKNNKYYWPTSWTDIDIYFSAYNVGWLCEALTCDYVADDFKSSKEFYTKMYNEALEQEACPKVDAEADYEDDPNDSKMEKLKKLLSRPISAASWKESLDEIDKENIECIKTIHAPEKYKHIDGEALAASTQKWLAKYIPLLANIPIVVLPRDVEEQCDYLIWKKRIQENGADKTWNEESSFKESEAKLIEKYGEIEKDPLGQWLKTLEIIL